MLKNHPNQWSFRYEYCKKCKSTDYPHHTRGYCVKCYQPILYRKRKGYYRKYYKKHSVKDRNMNYKTLNIIRKVIILPLKVLFYPIKMVFAPLWIIIGFFMTDWEDNWERDYYENSIKELWRF